LVGVEAGGKSMLAGEHAARFAGGAPGVLHGASRTCCRTRTAGASDAQRVAGLDCGGRAEHADLHAAARRYVGERRRGLAGFDVLASTRASWRRSRARTWSAALREERARGRRVLISPGARRQGPRDQLRLERRRAVSNRPGSLGRCALKAPRFRPFITAGDGGGATTLAVLRELGRAAPRASSSACRSATRSPTGRCCKPPRSARSRRGRRSSPCSNSCATSARAAAGCRSF
jgi:hypothetical protein